MKPETRFWSHLQGVLPEGHYSRVEPPPSPGIPDVNYCIPVNAVGIEGWLELKVRPNVQYPLGKRELLRTTQRAWHKRRARTHGRILTCVRIGPRILFIRPLDALRTSKTTTLNELIKMAVYNIPFRDPNITGLLLEALTGEHGGTVSQVCEDRGDGRTS